MFSGGIKFGTRKFKSMRKINYSFLIVTILSLASYSQAEAQAILSNDGGVIYINKNQSASSELEGKRGGYFGSHALGDTIQLVYDKFLKLYVKYESEGGAYATEKKVIYKEEIYKSVTKLNKHLTKLAKKGDIPESEAKTRLGNVINSAINIRFYETSGFEDMLKVTRDLELQEKYFNQIRIIGGN